MTRFSTQQLPKSPVKVSRKRQQEKTPPKANGVEGFMFTSPLLSPTKKSNRDSNRKCHVVRKKLNFVSVDATNDMMNEDEQKEEENRGVLFSPYPCTQTKHNYYTRSSVQKPIPVVVDKQERKLSGKFQLVKTLPNCTDCRQQKTFCICTLETKTLRIQQLSLIEEELDVTDLDTEEMVDSFLMVEHLQRLQSPYSQKTFSLPESERMTLVLDLDETLVHCSTEITKHDLHFTVDFQNREFHVYVQKRPFVLEFLAAVSEMFDVVIFTASQQIYADKLLDLLDPGRRYTKYRLFRDSCVPVEGTFVKDLRIFGRDLSRVVIVDNAIEAFSFQLSNGIPIKSWFEEPEDLELKKLFSLLQILNQQSDVRPFLEKKFGLNEKMLMAAQSCLQHVAASSI